MSWGGGSYPSLADPGDPQRQPSGWRVGGYRFCLRDTQMTLSDGNPREGARIDNIASEYWQQGRWVCVIEGGL